MNNDDVDSGAPVYLSWTTFVSGIQDLRSHGLPPVIDRSAWASKSGADKSAMLSGLKFLGLIDDAGNTQAILRALVKTEPLSNEEKKILSTLLKDRYSKVFALDVTTATPQQVGDTIGSYGASGSTRDRAIRFFLKAVEYCGIDISPRLVKGTRTRTGPSGNGAPKVRRKNRKKPPSSAQVDPAGQETAMKTIALPNADGSLTLSGNFNPLELVGDERDLVYAIVDKMKEFENETIEEE